MKTVVFWDIKSISYLTRENYVSATESYRAEVSPAMVMKNAVFWDIRPCGSCENRSFG
jgi:hypothetical protein